MQHTVEHGLNFIILYTQRKMPHWPLSNVMFFFDFTELLLQY